MDDKQKPTVSATRVRLGAVLLVLWWLPFWAATPWIADKLNIQGDSAQHTLFIVILIVQTLIGFVGLFLAGGEIAKLVRNSPKREVPKTLWHMLIHGQTR